MKIKHAIMTFTFALVAGLGTIGAVNLDKTAEVKEANAAAISNYAIEIRYSRPTSWSADPVIYTWEDGVSAVERTMTELWENEHGQKVYAFTPSSTYPLYANMIIKTSGSWDKKTKDLTTPTTAGIYNYYNDFNDATYVTIDKMKIYLYDYDSAFANESTVYAHVERDGASSLKFDDGTGIAMTKMTDASKGYVYSAEVSNAIDRVTFKNSSGSITTQKVSGSNANYVYYFGGGVNAWWNNIEYVLAHNWAQNLLNFRNVSAAAGEGADGDTCESLYSNAKSVYQYFIDHDTSALTEIKNGFADALARMSAWAEHHHEVFTVNDGIGAFSTSNSAITIYSIGNNSNNVTTVIIVVSVLSISTLGLFLFLKKRKESK